MFRISFGGGALPEYFPAWKKSVLKNKDIDFFFFTDSNDVKSEGNFLTIKITFEDYIKKISDTLGFQVSHANPYKLCDYRPAIGYVFHDELKGYDFWGYCDVDLIFGFIRNFITDDVLNKNDRILINGHFSLYRNCEKMNKLFMSEGSYPEYNYEEAFRCEEACYFDEFYGMALKCYRNNISIWKQDSFQDCNPAKERFENRKGNQIIVCWNQGKLDELEVNGNSRELLYCHFQKRKMQIKNENFKTCDSFYIVPGAFVCEPQNDIESLFAVNQGKLYGFWYRLGKLEKAVKKYGFVGMYQREKRRKDVLQITQKYIKK